MEMVWVPGHPGLCVSRGVRAENCYAWSSSPSCWWHSSFMVPCTFTSEAASVLQKAFSWSFPPTAGVLGSHSPCLHTVGPRAPGERRLPWWRFWSKHRLGSEGRCQIPEHHEFTLCKQRLALRDFITPG